MFAIYSYGILFALLLSAIYIFTKDDTNPSNYLPFFLGINSFLNYFPANPTTWYIGTYIYLILFWHFFLRDREITKKHLLVALLVENIIRYLLMSSGQHFTAYMLLPNWLTVFLMGMYLHRSQDLSRRMSAVSLLVIVWLGLLLVWSFIGSEIDFKKSFPFRMMSQMEPETILMTSLMVSTIYLLNTRISFQIARYLPENRYIAFFSRNTLIIFIIHMPINYGLSPLIYSMIDTVWIKKALMIFILFVGSALLSELLQRMINIKKLNEKAWPLFEQVLIRLKLSK